MNTEESEKKAVSEIKVTLTDWFKEIGLAVPNYVSTRIAELFLKNLRDAYEAGYNDGTTHIIAKLKFLMGMGGDDEHTSH